MMDEREKEAGHPMSDGMRCATMWLAAVLGQGLGCMHAHLIMRMWRQGRQPVVDPV